jgi:predicted dehydrogenase
MAGEKAVVVGAGGIAGAWFPPLAKEAVKVTAVVDLRVEQAQKRIEEYKLDALATTSLREAIRKTKPDFVIDLTIPEAHAKVTCTALAMGCPVIGEKPMASSLKEARRMVRAAEKAGRLYMVSQSRRWVPGHAQARKTLVDGAVGTLTTINCDF